jgi:hypothetical protein
MKDNISCVLTDDLSLFPLLIYNFQIVKITSSSNHPVEFPYLWKHSKWKLQYVIRKTYDTIFNFVYSMGNDLL